MTSNWLNALFLVGQSNKGLPQSESEELFTRELESKSALGSKKNIQHGVYRSLKYRPLRLEF